MLFVKCYYTFVLNTHKYNLRLVLSTCDRKQGVVILGTGLRGCPATLEGYPTPYHQE